MRLESSAQDDPRRGNAATPFKACLLIGMSVLCTTAGTAQPTVHEAGEPCEAAMVLRDRTASRGLTRYSSTFGHAVGDVDNDGDDDLVVSNHGVLPALFLNQDGRFTDRSDLLPFTDSRDRHGITLVDADNDGDRDLLVAGGGGGRESASGGLENQVVRNLLIETGQLTFEFEPPSNHGISLKRWRGRHLLPLPSRDGSRVDLYFLAKAREGKNSRYLRAQGSGIRYGMHSMPGFGPLVSDGSDIPLDFDRDGRVDLLMLRLGKPLLLRNRGGSFEPVETPFDDVGRVTAAAAGDLDGDGYAEIYLGTHAPVDLSDQILWNGGEVHFTAFAQSAGDSESVSFVTDSDEIEVDLRYLRGLTRQSTDTVFIGSRGVHPARRTFIVSFGEAWGRPQFAGPGVYLWTTPSTGRWHVQVHYRAIGDHEVGVIKGSAIRQLRTRNLERYAVEPTRDRIYRNLAGAGFEELNVGGLVHERVTRSVTMVDVDNNGWLDIAVLRGGQWGASNGRSLVVTNCGGLSFGLSALPNPGSRIYSASELTFGFLDGDVLPDLFLTNGWGPAPGNRGPYRLLLNRSAAAGDAVVLELSGTVSNRDALGAQVEIVDGHGRLLGYRLLADRGRAQDSHRLHFGLGGHAGPVFARVRWPSGQWQTTRELIRNQVLRIVEPDSVR